MESPQSTILRQLASENVLTKDSLLISPRATPRAPIGGSGLLEKKKTLKNFRSVSSPMPNFKAPVASKNTTPLSLNCCEDLVFLEDFEELKKEMHEKPLAEFLNDLIKEEKETSFLMRLTELEIQEDMKTTIRQESDGAHLMKIYWFEHVGPKLLESVVVPFVREVEKRAKERAFEEEKSETMIKYTPKTYKLVRKMLAQFLEALRGSSLEPNFRQILRHIYHMIVLQKDHITEGSPLFVFCGYIILRFIGPAISAPKIYLPKFISEVSDDARKILILSLKILQSIANNIVPQPESDLAEFTDFIQSEIPAMRLWARLQILPQWMESLALQ